MRFKIYYFLLAFIVLSANLCFAQTAEISSQTAADNQTIQPVAQNDESLVSEQNITEKNTVEQPMSLTLLLNGYFPMNNPDEKTGFGIDYSSFPQFKDTSKNIYASDIKVFFEIGARF